ncbi:thiolase family protein [Aeromicrobium sp. Leaf350]|uniref:thiolase family protein n=1 Tax=Aeromicrobium sp. Leaf350 TaxID=2876565 RepID=UPI001E2E7654|nr:thiolase family protein [Aeromicrobium sp. Leaf350]
MTGAHIYAATRTPFGRFGGGLAGVRPDDLAAATLSSLLSKTPNLDPALIGDVYWGNANGAGEENRNVGRMAVLLAGLPTSVPATTINRLCGSSLDAAMMASRAVETGDVEIAVVGGVESMTRAPWVLPKPARAFAPGDMQAVSTTLGWRLVNPRMPSEWTVSLGECNELLSDRLGISRERQDRFAERSHRLAGAAWDSGFYAGLVAPVPGVQLNRDESIRPGTTLESLSGLKASFRPDGTITAGNASPLSDGASSLLIAAESAAERLGAAPLARIAGRGVHALDPQDFGIAPVDAASRALKAAGISWREVGAVELNEAFAVQSIACVDAWGIDPEIVNTKGGAIALGHPLGASGARVLGTLAHRLRDSGERWGVAGICIGVGQALAVVLENTTV